MVFLDWDYQVFLKKSSDCRVFFDNQKSIESHMKEGLDYSKVKVESIIANGHSGRICKVMYIDENKHLNMPLVMKEIIPAANREDFILSQIKLLDLIYEISVPPRSFPRYYGYAKQRVPGNVIYYLFFEFYPKNLRTLINENPDHTLPFETMCQYLRDLINGFAYLETMGYSHGDIKPENLMITATGQIKIIDFGSAQQAKPDDVMEYQFKGTKAYQSPEIFTANGRDSFNGNLIKSDVFIFGLIAFEMAGIFRININEEGESRSRITQFHDMGEFSNEITNWKEDFDLKFQNLWNENNNKKLLLAVQGAVNTDYENRPDFVKMFVNILKISSNEKLKFCVLIEDEVGILDDSEEKKLRREIEEQEHPSLETRCMKIFKCLPKSLSKRICRRGFIFCLCFSLYCLFFELISLNSHANYWYSLQNVDYYLDSFPDVYRSLKGILVIDSFNVILSVGCLFLGFFDFHKWNIMAIVGLKILFSVIRFILGIVFLAGNNSHCKNLLDFYENKEEYKDSYNTLFLAWSYDIFLSIWLYLNIFIIPLMLPWNRRNN